jgi:hypothetical protein
MRRLLTMAVLVIGTVLGGAAELRAQTRADTAAILLNAARELRARGDMAAARGLLDYIKSQYGGTAAAAEVDQLRVALQGTPEAERGGRVELMVGGAMYGAWLGIAIPIIAKADGPEAFGVGLLLGAPAGFLAGRAYTRAHPLTEGQARALTFGTLWGTAQGFGWAEVFELGQEVVQFCPPTGDPCYITTSGNEAPARTGAAVVGGLAGMGVGAMLARKPITAGTAAAVTLSGMWGTWFGFGGAYLADLNDDDLLAAAMLAGNAALIGGALAAPAWRMTESRARLISVGGLIGGLAGGGLWLIIQPDNERTAIAYPLIGSAAGLVAGVHWTRSRGASPPSGGRGDDARGALLNGNEGRWALDLPAASVTLRRTESGLQPAAYVPLLRARF